MALVHWYRLCRKQAPFLRCNLHWMGTRGTHLSTACSLETLLLVGASTGFRAAEAVAILTGRAARTHRPKLALRGAQESCSLWWEPGTLSWSSEAPSEETWWGALSDKGKEEWPLLEQHGITEQKETLAPLPRGGTLLKSGTLEICCCSPSSAGPSSSGV